jgi:hypothetical protein
MTETAPHVDAALLEQQYRDFEGVKLNSLWTQRGFAECRALARALCFAYWRDCAGRAGIGAGDRPLCGRETGARGRGQWSPA